MNKIYNGHSKASGIYQIKNLINGKIYIGQAKQLAARAIQHEQSLISKKHANKHLQAAWNLYGSEAFEFAVLQVVEDKAERDLVEQTLITQFYGYGCYNIRKEVLPLSEVWSHTPEESRKKMSKAKKGHKASQETKEKMSKTKKGKINSFEHNQRIREAKLGIPRSQETIQKMNGSRKGKPCSERRLAALAELNKNRVGTRASEETKLKMSEARKTYWAKRRVETPDPCLHGQSEALLEQSSSPQVKLESVQTVAVSQVAPTSP